MELHVESDLSFKWKRAVKSLLKYWSLEKILPQWKWGEIFLFISPKDAYVPNPQIIQENSKTRL